MINLTKDEFAQVIHEVIKELDMPEIVLPLITIGAMIGAKAEMKTEKKEDCKIEEKEDCLAYRAGNYKIVIATRHDNKAHLIITHKERIVVDSMLDSLHKAYEFAFNILLVR